MKRKLPAIFHDSFLQLRQRSVVWWNKSKRAESRGFQAVFDEHAGFVFRCARGHGFGEAEAEDVVQDVFLVVHRKLHELRADEAIRAWLYRITENVVRDHKRSYARRREDLKSEPDGATISGESAERAIAVEQAHAILLERLSRLSDEQREVFWLVEIEGATATEIAAALGVSVNTVYSRHRLAKANYERTLHIRSVAPVSTPAKLPEGVKHAR